MYENYMNIKMTFVVFHLKKLKSFVFIKLFASSPPFKNLCELTGIKIVQSEQSCCIITTGLKQHISAASVFLKKILLHLLEIIDFFKSKFPLLHVCV